MRPGWRTVGRTVRRTVTLLALLASISFAAAQGDLGALRATAEAEGRVRVLVELATPTQPEARLGTASLEAQRARIAAAQTAVLRTLGNEVRSTRRYATLPLLALEVGPTDLEALAGAADVARVFPDRRNYPTLGATVPRVGAPDVWNLGFDGAGTTVAVLDTGVDVDHPTFDATTVREACFSTHAPDAGVTSLCRDAATEDVGPGAAAPDEDLPGAFHGTHVASTAVGGGGGPVAAGVAPAADLLAVEVFSRGEACWGAGTPDCTFALDSDVLAGLEHALANQGAWNLAAVNLSLGTISTWSGTCDTAYDAVFRDLRAAGVGVIVASGNGGVDGGISSPGCAADAIAIGATEMTTAGERVADYTNVAPGLALLAPGSDVVAAVPGGGAGRASGTSMAAPHVAGAWALARAAGERDVLASLRGGGVPVAHDGATFPRLDLRFLAADRDVPDLTFADTPTVAPSEAVLRDGAFEVPVEACAAWSNVGSRDAAPGGTFTALEATLVGEGTTRTVGRVTTDVVAAGARTESCFDVAPPLADGAYEVRFTLDPEGAVTEASEANPVATATFTVASPPANDAFADRIALAGASGETTGTNALATREPGEPDPTYYVPPGASVWWTWTPDVTTRATFDTRGSDFDTVLAVYEGDALGRLERLAYSDDAATGDAILTSRVTFTAHAGRAYALVVDGFTDTDAADPTPDTGTVRLAWSSEAITCDVAPRDLRPLGDVDDDGAVTAADALRILRLAGGSVAPAVAEDPLRAEGRHADLDADGATTRADAQRALDVATGATTAPRLHASRTTLALARGEVGCVIVGNAGGGTLPPVTVDAGRGTWARDVTPDGLGPGRVVAVLRDGAEGGTLTLAAGAAGTVQVEVGAP